MTRQNGLLQKLMRHKFERRSTGKHTLKRVAIFWIVFSFVLFILLVFFYYLRILEKKNVFVSPVSKQNQEQQTEHVNTITGVLREKHLDFSSVFPFDQNSYLIKLVSGEEVLLTGSKSLVEQVSSLQLILSRLTIEGKRVSRVDFRFDTPVLKMQ